MQFIKIFQNELALIISALNFDLVLLLQMGECEFLRVELISADFTAEIDQRFSIIKEQL